MEGGQYDPTYVFFFAGGGSNLLLGLALALVGVSSTYAGSWTTFMGHDTVAVPPKLTVAEADSYFVAVQADIYGVTRVDTTVDDTMYTILTVPEYGYTTEVGKPMVPVVTVLVAVPDSVDISLSLAAYDYTTIEDIIIYPVPKESTSCDTCCCFEVFTKDSATYNTDAFYPGTLAELDTTSHLRSQRIAQIKMYPIQFNPVDAVVKAYHYLRPELTLSGNPVENTVGLGPFEKIGRRCLLNYKPNSTVIEDTTGDVHIITDPKDTTTIADYLIVIADSLWDHGDYDALAEWRADHNYFDVGFIKLKKIMKAFCPDDTLYYPAPDDECLKDFFEYAYEEYRAPQMPDSHLGYVLLVGDVRDADSVPMIPTHLSGGSKPYPLDVWFSLLDGEQDKIPEFAIGRLSVHDSEELKDVAGKTYDYEHTPDTTHWRREVVVAIAEGSSGFEEEIEDIFSSQGYETYSVMPDLCGGWNDTLYCHLNAGKIMATYGGHGYWDVWCGPCGGFRASEVETLKNGLKLPFVIPSCCLSGKFDAPGDCMGEAFLKNPDGGGIAYVGASTTTVSAEGFVKATARAIVDDQQWLIGNAIQEARLRAGVREDLNLLGDPAVDLGDYTAYPGVPDLVASAKHIKLVPEYPSFGDSLTIQARIFNIGSGYATNFDVTVLDSCQQQGSTIAEVTIDTLGAREDTLLEFTWSTAPDTMYDIGTHKIVVWLDSDSTVDESWEGNNTAFVTERIFFYPNEDGWPVKTTGAVRSSPVVVDLFKDSKLEIVIGCDNDTLYVFHASGDPDSGWADSTGAPVQASPVVGDLDNDGTFEVVAAAGNKLFAWDTTGTLLTDWPIALCDSTSLVYTPALADIDCDDTLDIIVPADSSIYVIRYDTSSVPNWPIVVDSNVFSMSSPAIADIDDDDHLEIFVSVHRNGEEGIGGGYWDSCYVYAWDDTGAALSGWPPERLQGLERSPLSPALANLDDSGDWEIMTGLGDSMYVWDDSGTPVSPWPVDAPPTRVSSSPAVGDLDTLSSGYEIIAGCVQDSVREGRIYAWESDGDVAELSWPVKTKGSVRSSPALANIDSSASSPDGHLDVIVGSDGGYVYAFDNEGERLANFPFPTGAAVTSSPAIADIDCDGDLELVVGCEDGYVLFWFIEGAECDIGAAPWPMFKHDRKRTAWFEHTP